MKIHHIIAVCFLASSAIAQANPPERMMKAALKL